MTHCYPDNGYVTEFSVGSRVQYHRAVFGTIKGVETRYKDGKVRLYLVDQEDRGLILWIAMATELR